jgi:hypothetical protein
VVYALVRLVERLPPRVRVWLWDVIFLFLQDDDELAVAAPALPTDEPATGAPAIRGKISTPQAPERAPVESSRSKETTSLCHSNDVLSGCADRVRQT